MEPLRKAMVDPDPYVRKTAAIGVGKLFHQNARLFHEEGFAQELVKMLNDNYSVVSSNAAVILSEINSFGAFPQKVKKEWVAKLMNALPETSEWGQCYIMELLSTYSPQSADEANQLLERVVARLGHSNPSVVLAAIKLLASLGPRCSSEIAAQYTARINSALLTLAKMDSETQYVVYRNIHVLLVLFPTLLADNLDSFYIRFNDPSYVKIEKLRLLLKLTNELTAASVVKELEECSKEVDFTFAKEVVSAIATAAMKVPSIVPKCSEMLASLASKRMELLPQIIIATKNIVRKYPDLLLLEALIRDHGADTVTDEEAKVALIWMLGEYCDFVVGGPEILQQQMENLLVQEPSIQLALLTAVVKVFLRNPSGMESTLNKILQLLSEHSQYPDLRDRAFGYWRLLSKGIGVEKMKMIVHGQKPPVDVDRTFSDAMTRSEMRVSVNTSAAVFARPYSTFLPSYGMASIGAVDNLEEDEEDGEDPVQVSPPVTEAPPKPATTVQRSNQSALDDLFDVPTKGEVGGLPLLFSDGAMCIHGALCIQDKTLQLRLINSSPQVINSFSLQINKNVFGVVPAQTLESCLPSEKIEPQHDVHVTVPLRVSDGHFAISVERLCEVEVGIKSSRSLMRFFVSASVKDLLLETPVLEKSLFGQQWKSMDESCEAKMLLGPTGARMLATVNLSAVLATFHISTVAVAHKDGQDLVYGNCKSSLGVSSLFELVLVKMEPSKSYLCCKSPRVNDVLPVLKHVLDESFRCDSTSGHFF